MNDMTLNYHLMHPGGDSMPGDPNAAFCLDGVYHLHYILNHPWKEGKSCSFVHVTSPDMLHWRWQTTKLQPSFTEHGMYSGTGFITKEGQPAVIYHGAGSGRNQIAVELRIFVDKYLVEVFANNRQAVLTAHMDYAGRTGLDAFTVGATTELKSLEIWKLKPTNQGFLEAQNDRIWEPDRE